MVTRVCCQLDNKTSTEREKEFNTVYSPRPTSQLSPFSGREKGQEYYSRERLSTQNKWNGEEVTTHLQKKKKIIQLLE